jgi:hypothetical protein
MEKMYRDYKDIAEFRIVYIREAHAADSSWPMRFARERGINEHKDYGDRCMVAERMMEEESVTIPCIIDDFDNRVNTAYKAWPTRLFVVRKDGKLAVAASRGPWGFKPALKKAGAWLAEYRKIGSEPEIPNK